MSRLRHVTALVLTLLLVHVTLVGSGFTCIAGGGGSSTDMAEMGMAGMPDMDDMPPSDSSAPYQSGLPASPAPTPDPCSLPWAPAGCTLMIPCAPHAIAPYSPAIADLSDSSSAVVASEFATPLSVILALDTPPPRA